MGKGAAAAAAAAADSDDEDPAAQAEAKMAAREKRLTVAMETLELTKPLGDADVDLVQQSSEWRDHQDSSDDDEGKARVRRASESHARRESRIADTIDVQRFSDACVSPHKA